MLKAVGKGKARISEVTGDGHRDPKEDLITSAIFGPLAYFGSVAAPFLNEIISRTEFDVFPSFCANDKIEFLFWEKWKNVVPGKTSVEPDLLVKVVCGKKVYVIIVEVKWDAPLGDNQLQDQWKGAQKYYDSKLSDLELMHLLIVRSFNKNDDVQFRQHPEKQNVRRLTWKELSEVAFGLTFVKGGLGLWAKDVFAFLAKMGVRSQVSWHQVKLEHQIPLLPSFAEKLIGYIPETQIGWGKRTLNCFKALEVVNGQSKTLLASSQLGWAGRKLAPIFRS